MTSTRWTPHRADWWRVSLPPMAGRRYTRVGAALGVSTPGGFFTSGGLVRTRNPRPWLEIVARPGGMVPG